MAIYIFQLVRKSLIANKFKRLNSLYNEEYEQRTLYLNTVIRNLGLGNLQVSQTSIRQAYSVIESEYWPEIEKRLVRCDSDTPLGRKVFDIRQAKSTSEELERTQAKYSQVREYRNLMRNAVLEVGEAIHNGERVPRSSKSHRISVVKCPSCAGPLPDNITRKCPYCGSALAY